MRFVLKAGVGLIRIDEEEDASTQPSQLQPPTQLAPISQENQQSQPVEASKRPKIVIRRRAAEDAPQKPQACVEKPPAPPTLEATLPSTSSVHRVDSSKQYTYIVELQQTGPGELSLVFTQTFGNKVFEIGPRLKQRLSVNTEMVRCHQNMGGQTCYIVPSNPSLLKMKLPEVDREDGFTYYYKPFASLTDKLRGLGPRRTDALSLERLEHPRKTRVSPVLHAHQKEGVKSILDHNGNLLLADAPGLGKTLTALWAALHYNRPILIIAPAMLHEHWMAHVFSFFNGAGELLFAARDRVYTHEKRKGGGRSTPSIGTATQASLDRLQLTKEQLDSIYAQYSIETLQLCWEQMQPGLRKKAMLRAEAESLMEQGLFPVFTEADFSQCPYLADNSFLQAQKNFVAVVSITGLGKLCNIGAIKPERYFVIVDEAHEYKEIQTERTKTLLQTLAKPGTNKLLLTATPVLNNVGELFPLFKLLGVPLSHAQFVSRYCELDDQAKFKVVKGVKNQFELRYLINTFILRRGVTGQKLPSVQRIIQILDDSKEQPGTQPEAQQARQFNPMTEYAKDVMKKQDAALAFLTQFAEQGIPFVVFFVNLNNLEAFKSFPRSAQIHGQMLASKRVKTIQQFQEGEIDALFCTIDSIAVGLDVTRAKACFWLQMEWTAALFQQAEGRLRRISSKYSTIYSVILSAKTFWDTRVKKIVDAKQELMQWVFNEPAEPWQWLETKNALMLLSK